MFRSDDNQEREHYGWIPEETCEESGNFSKKQNGFKVDLWLLEKKPEKINGKKVDFRESWLKSDKPIKILDENWNEIEDRRKVPESERNPEKRRAFNHELWTLNPHIDINDPKRLNHLWDTQVLVNEFLSDWLLIKKYNYWSVVLKHAPFSSKDLMVVYTWDNPNITNIWQFKNPWNWELDELFSILQILTSGVYDKKYDLVNRSKEELLIWNNITVIPWSWEAQSLREPHFHFTIFPTIAWTENKVNTIISTLWNNKKIFPINEINILLIKYLVEYLGLLWIIPKKEINLKDHNNLAIDIKLPHENYFLWEKNFIHFIYTEIRNFHSYINKNRINTKLKEYDNDYSNSRISNSISFFIKNWTLYMRIRYSYRNKLKNERWWSAANGLHIVTRVPWMEAPDLNPFKEKVKLILDDPELLKKFTI